jgi:hypothetical protein
MIKFKKEIVVKMLSLKTPKLSVVVRLKDSLNNIRKIGKVMVKKSFTKKGFIKYKKISPLFLSLIKMKLGEVNFIRRFVKIFYRNKYLLYHYIRAYYYISAKKRLKNMFKKQIKQKK